MKWLYITFLVICMISLSGCSKDYVFVSSSSTNNITSNVTNNYYTTYNYSSNVSISSINRYVLVSNSNNIFNVSLNETNLNSSFVQHGEIVSAVGNWSLDKPSILYFNTSKSGIGNCSLNQFQTADAPNGISCAGLFSANISDKNNLINSHTHTVANLTDKNNLANTHTHDAANITTGVLPVTRGGTGTASSTGSGAVVFAITPSIANQTCTYGTQGNVNCYYKLGNITGSLTCNTASDGELSYNYSSHHPVYCNGSSWVQI